MNLVHPPRPRDVFYQALERPSAERAAFVASACAGDSAVLREVHELLEAFDQAEHALEPVATQTVVSADSSRLVGTRIGSYHIRRLIAAGGMGAVYEATQDHPRRAIALKLMRQGIASRSALRRFEYESQVLGRLRHSGIAQIYEAGTHDNGAGAIPYFAMEYIPGARTLIEYAADQKLGTRPRLRLFAAVCDAVHHGHQKGIIHRDLKPSNILVDTTGQAKIIDFGVARSTDSDMAVTMLQTDVGQLIGTLQYMSPEQCAADPHDIDTRSDVYALGVILYELLCERLPYDLGRVAIHEATLVIREHMPPKPSGVNRALRGDAETIVLKALEKNRGRRYQSAGDLAEDIQRYLRDEPIAARPPSVLYQFRTFARRNRAVVSAVATLFVVLMGTSVVVSMLWLGAKSARNQAERERDAKVALAGDAVALFAQQLTGGVIVADRERNEPLARTLIQEAQKYLQQKFSAEPAVLVECVSALGGAFQSMGDFEQAEMQFSRARDIAARAWGADNEQTIMLSSRLASAYRGARDFKRAEQLYLEVLAAIRRTGIANVGPWEPLADMYLDLGRCAEAEKVLVEVIGLLSQPPRSALDPVYCMTNLANVHRTQGRFAEADRVLSDVLDRCAKAPERDKLMWARPTRELARLRLAEGRPEEARTLQLKALDGFQQQPGIDPDAMDIVMCIELSGLIDLQLERVTEAKAAFATAAERADRSFQSEQRWWAAHFRVGAAKCLMHEQRYDEAEQMLKAAYAALLNSLGDAHHRTQNCIGALADLYETTGQSEVSATWRRKLRSSRCE